MSKIYEMNTAPVFKEPGSLCMTSDFGYRIDPLTGRGNSAHKGFDCVRWTGYMNVATIVAFDTGTVYAVCKNVTGTDTVNPNNSAGNYVCIRHENGYTTKYFHLAYKSIPSNIKVGTVVSKGQKIGYMGSTGNSTGAHLHFQVEKDGIPVDPKPFLIEGKPFVNPVVIERPEETEDTIKLDNDPSEWAQEAVEWSISNNILRGDDKGNYKLHSECTREEAMVLLERYEELL